MLGSFVRSLRRQWLGVSVGSLALVVAVSGSPMGAYAAGLVTGAGIKDGTVTSADLRNGTVTGTDVRDGSIGARDLAAGVMSAGGTAPAGPAGPAGPTGPTGPQGEKGEKGDPGDDASGVSWRGAYDPTKSYAVGDAVSSGGQSYVARMPHSACTAIACLAAPQSSEFDVLAAKGAPGLAGPQGAQGAKGDRGDKGDPGLSGYERVEEVHAVTSPLDEPQGFSIGCPAGKVPLSGGFYLIGARIISSERSRFFSHQWDFLVADNVPDGRNGDAALSVVCANVS